MNTTLDDLKKQLQERANHLLGSDPQWAYLKGKIEGLEEALKPDESGAKKGGK